MWLEAAVCGVAVAAACWLRPWRALGGHAPPWPWLAWWALLPLFWAEEHSWQVQAFSLAFVIAGAALFSFARFRKRKIPQEAIIGIVYVAASALSVMILDRNPHGQEKIEEHEAKLREEAVEE